MKTSSDAEPHREQDRRRPETALEQRDSEQREADEAEHGGADGAVAGEAARGQGRALADGGDRRHARRADRRPQAGEDGDEDADEERDDDRARLERQAGARQREADESNSDESPCASATPSTRPTSEAITPSTSDSKSTDRSTCRREAPIVRSVANSRVRCATVIESEFAITNAPTKSAMPPKASRKSCRKLRKVFVSLASSCGLALPGPHLGRRAAGSSRSPRRAAAGDARASPRRGSGRACPPCRRAPARSAGRSRPALRRRCCVEPPKAKMPARCASSAPGPAPGCRSTSPDREVLVARRALSIDDLVRPRPGPCDEDDRAELGAATGRR